MQRAESSSASTPAKPAAPGPQPVIAGVDGIEGLPPQEKLAALRRVQLQAEQRIRLGMQLFKAAEAHVTGQQGIVEDLRNSQAQLREDLQSDVARSFRSYDEWMGEFGGRITDRMEKMESRIEQLQHRWVEIEKRIHQMVKRAEALVEQSRHLLEDGVSNIARREMAQARQPRTPAAPAIPTAPGMSADMPCQNKSELAADAKSGASAPVSRMGVMPVSARPVDSPAEDAPAEPVFLKVIDQVRKQTPQASPRPESQEPEVGEVDGKPTA
jgi:hypothetical protein